MLKFKRNSVIALYVAGNSQVAIVRAFHHFNVSKSFVSCNIARYRDTGSVASHPPKSGRKKAITIPEIIRKVKTRFDRNPCRND